MKRIERLEANIIEALAEARAARILAEKCLDKILAQPTLTQEPWTATTQDLDSPSLAQPTAPFIKEVDVTPKPTLAGFAGGAPSALKKEGGVRDEIWDDVVGMEEEESGG